MKRIVIVLIVLAALAAAAWAGWYLWHRGEGDVVFRTAPVTARRPVGIH